MFVHALSDLAFNAAAAAAAHAPAAESLRSCPDRTRLAARDERWQWMSCVRRWGPETQERPIIPYALHPGWRRDCRWDSLKKARWTALVFR